MHVAWVLNINYVHCHLKALFVSYGVICLLCSPLLAIWTSPKSNVSMVNWLVYCRFDLDYRIAWRVWITFSKNQKTATSMACARPTNYNSILLASVIFASLYQ